MCGIVGILNRDKNRNVSEQVLEEMLLVINYRGPDERGVYCNKNLGLGNVRLSIIDLSSGQQPLCDTTGNYWIVFNGEIFNYIELRSQLEDSGYQFKTRSDTEVIVAGYSIWGTSLFNKLNGQFAFAIWDKLKMELLLVRDRVGICPLFYTIINDSIVFASEIKAILQHPGVRAELSIPSLIQVLTYWSALSPSTIFTNINNLTPGNFLKVSHKFGITVQPYWNLEFPARNDMKDISLVEAGEKLKEILEDAVKIRLRADVKVAAYLSGGLDSTSTTSIIKHLEPGLLHTFSIGFSDKVFDETRFQQEASKYLDTNHKSIECTNDDVTNNFRRVIWHAESPMMRTAPAPMYMLSEFVNQNGIKVVITGEGADEMLAGYDIFKEMLIRRFWARDPASKLRPLLLKKLYPYIPQISNSSSQSLRFFYGFRLEDTDSPVYSHIMRWNNGRHILKYLHPDYAEIARNFDPYKSWLELMPADFNDWGDLGKAQYLESSLFMSGYLLSSQGDRMTMANSVEGRYPFLDHRLIEFSASLPEKYKLNGLNEKFLLKKIMKDQIPASIIRRNKQAYRAPISASFFGKSESNYVDSILDSKMIEDYGIFDPAMTRKLVEKIKKTGSASEVENMIVTAIISTQLFQQFFILGQTPFPMAKPTMPLRVIVDK